MNFLKLNIKGYIICALYESIDLVSRNLLQPVPQQHVVRVAASHALFPAFPAFPTFPAFWCLERGAEP